MPHPRGGFVVVDKPPGPTSHDLVMAVRRVCRTRAVGHCGTLDPFASGVLVVLVGELTRLADMVGGTTKRYLATATLGTETTTDDLTGDRVSGADPSGVTDEALRAALHGLRGPLMQTPPAFSAKHVDGVRAHELARAGATVELPAVPVTVHALELVERHGASVVLDVTCSRGTYIRALARDLGRALGVGAHLQALRRTAVGSFTEADAVPLNGLAPEHVHGAMEMTRHVASAELAPDEAHRVRQGMPVTSAVVGARGWEPGEQGLLACGQDLVALAQARAALAAGITVGPGTLVPGRRFPALQ